MSGCLAGRVALLYITTPTPGSTPTPTYDTFGVWSSHGVHARPLKILIFTVMSGIYQEA